MPTRQSNVQSASGVDRRRCLFKPPSRRLWAASGGQSPFTPLQADDSTTCVCQVAPHIFVCSILVGDFRRSPSSKSVHAQKPWVGNFRYMLSFEGPCRGCREIVINAFPEFPSPIKRILPPHRHPCAPDAMLCPSDPTKGRPGEGLARHVYPRGGQGLPVDGGAGPRTRRTVDTSCIKHQRQEDRVSDRTYLFAFA